VLQQPERLRMRPHDTDTDTGLAAVVRAAAAGDPAALRRLVERFEPLLRRVARSYRLSSWDADDVIQATWLQFLQHGRSLREPSAVSGWLATTARRQSLWLLQRHVRERLSDDPACDEVGDWAGPEDELLEAERSRLLQGALGQLPQRQRNLMRVLVAQPELSYEEVGQRLGMPVGSIGPTRARSLVRLRGDDGLRALQAAGV